MGRESVCKCSHTRGAHWAHVACMETVGRHPCPCPRFESRGGEADTVDCDRNCGALAKPVTLEEFRAALEHWEHHPYLNGCSHGC